jgi:hypothetical protein
MAVFPGKEIIDLIHRCEGDVHGFVGRRLGNRTGNNQSRHQGRDGSGRRHER